MERTYGVRLHVQMVGENEDEATLEFCSEIIAIRGEHLQMQQLALAAGDAAFETLMKILRGGTDGSLKKA